MLLRFRTLRIEAMHLRARLALASAEGTEREQRLRIAEGLGRKLANERLPWSDPLATLISAAVARQRGDDSKAARLTSRAVEEFELADMQLYAAAARRRLGEIMNDDGGAELIARSEDWMRKQQIKNPARFSNMLAPGF